MIGGHSTCLHGGCHSSNSFPLLFISHRNVIGPTDLLAYISICYWLSSNAKPRTTQTDTMYFCPVVLDWSDSDILFLTTLQLGDGYTLLYDWYMVKCTVYQL